jgi:hypothetical protein
MTKLLVAIIEDNPDMLGVLEETFYKSPHFETISFENPCRFLMDERKVDLVISDWCFGHNDLSFYLAGFDLKKLIILTGSLGVIDVECLAVLNKRVYLDRLLPITTALLKQIYPSRF